MSLPASPVSKKPTSKAKPRSVRTQKREAQKTAVSVLKEEEDATPRTPSQIPLPDSASPSPPPSTAPSSQASVFASVASLEPHAYRSPKRTFDESSASSHSESSQSAAKRAKSASRAASTSRDPALGDTIRSPSIVKDPTADADDLDTPDLSAIGSSADSLSSLSSMSSPEPTPPPPEPPAEKRLTRRQRKALGLPKPRAVVVGSTVARTRSAGKIVVPGGKYKTSSKAAVADGSEDDPEVNAEWRKNGTGRLDVRGFRELKI